MKERLGRGVMIAVTLSGAVCGAATLKIDADRTVHETNRRKLTSSNIALWNQTWELGDSDLHEYVRELKPALIRIPGGSWANHYYWNGNGVRTGESDIDMSKHRKDGTWEVDYSGFAPGFCVEGDDRHPISDGFHGAWDVQQLHEFVETFGARPIVTVNVGSGTPEMAAEWVRWANKKKNYNVQYWELGNELEGGWELGHILPDGSEMTGEVYAQRFLKFAKAMKAVDPSIKTGGPASSNDRGAFIEELLRDAGDEVDFISFHTYPVENRVLKEEDFFNEIFNLEKATSKFRGWIEKYQPKRKDQIELAITEWNSKVVEDRITADLMNGLWCAIWVGEMFRDGISFANEWDMMTATPTGGHGLFYFKQFDFEQPGVPQEEMDRQFKSFDPPCIPKGQYWALYLWSRYMGDRMVDSSLKGAENLYTAVTRSEDAMQIMFVNTSRDAVQTVQLNSSKPLAKEAIAVQLSHREYFWNPFSRSPQWSRKPEPVKISLAGGSVVVPPFSVLVLQVPWAGKSLKPLAKPLAPRKGKEEIELLLSASTPEDVPVEAWVLMPDSASYAPDEKPLTASLEIEGPGKLDVKTIRLNEGAGRFFIQPNGTGKIKIVATCGKAKATAELEAMPVQERTEILWRFEGDDGLKGMKSDYALSLSDTAKPNQQTAAITLDKALPGNGKGVLMTFGYFPESLPKERVGGVVLDLRTSHGFACSDSHARIEVVLQSANDHWIPIGSVPLGKLGEKWKSFKIPLPGHEHLDSMKWLYSIRLQLQTSKPASGEIYINDAGVILR